MEPDSQLQGFKDFETTSSIRKNGRKSRGLYVKNEVSKFIKSALADDPPLPDPSHTSHGLASPPRPSRSGSKPGVKKTGVQNSNSSSRKKMKLGPSNWDRMLSEVKWPGLEEQRADSETSDIDSYSDEGSGQVAVKHSSLDDIYTDEDDCESNAVREDVRMKRTNRWRMAIDSLHTSTPLQRSTETETSVECIADFDSPQSSDGDTTSPCTPPHSTLHTSHTINRPTERSTSNFTFDLRSMPDDVTISTPPSSPEIEPESEHTLTRTKASDWLRQVSLDSETSRIVETDANDTAFSVKTPHDSAKKLSTKHRRRKFVEGGLAKQLEKVVQREEVEVTFWEHKVKSLEERDVDLSSCLTIQVLTLTHCYSLFLANCQLLQGKPSSETALTESSEISVLFSPRCAKWLDLRVGSQVRIHPPWQCLSLPSLSLDVVLCALFCQSLALTPSIATPISPVPCKQRGVVGMLTVSSPLKSPVPTRTCLKRSPVKSLPTYLFKDGNKVSEDKINTTTEALLTTPPREGPSKSSRVPDHPSTLLDGIEHAQCGVVDGLTGRVVRVYRRKSGESVRILSSDKQQYHSVQRLLLYTPNTSAHGSKVTWCLLVCDATGLYAEVQILHPDSARWTELVRVGEGEVVHLTHLRLIRRTNSSRNPEIISLISALKLNPPETPLLTTSPDSQDSTSFCPTSPVFPHNPPSACYLLQTSPESKALLASEALGAVLPVTVKTRYNTQSAGRMSLLGRVVYFSSEYPHSEEPSSLQALCAASCGRYLHILTPSTTHTLPSHSSTSPHPSLVLVYLKPSFSTDGLQDLLSTPGAKVLLQDVCCDLYGAEYSMNACSMIIPVSTSKTLVHGFYPAINLTNEEVSLLDGLGTPDLPQLDQNNACQRALVSVNGRVVDVDEDNAYSWSVCNVCGNQELIDTPSELFCSVCQRAVLTPDTHMHLAVYVKCKGFQTAHIHVTLLQSTINQILPVSTASTESGYDIHCVLGKWLQLATCFVEDTLHNPDGTVLLKLKEIAIHF